MQSRIPERTIDIVGVLQEEENKLNRHNAAQECDAREAK